MRNALRAAAVCLAVLFALPVFAQNPPYRHGVMRLDADTLQARMDAYANAPRVPTIDQIAAVSALNVSSGSGTSFDLLGYSPWNASNMADRNQGSCGNCWVWAGTGVMEIALGSARRALPTGSRSSTTIRAARAREHREARARSATEAT